MPKDALVGRASLNSQSPTIAFICNIALPNTKGLAQLLYRQLVSYCFQFAPQLVKAFITVPDQPFCAASFGAERRLPIGTA
jgi:hypothetical protein